MPVDKNVDEEDESNISDSDDHDADLILAPYFSGTESYSG